MADTSNLTLPLLAAGQAQKHVTVNEALGWLDLLVHLAAGSRSLTTPPASPRDGDRYIVAPGAGGAWAGRDHDVAAFLNGGWEFLPPRAGWRAFIEDEARDAVFAAGVWSVPSGGGGGGSGGGEVSLLEFDHALSGGGAQDTSGLIPAGSLVLGVTARVLGEISGVAGWSLGVPGAPMRYGTGYGTAAGLGLRCVTVAPLAYVADLPFRITPEGGDFTGGSLRLRIHRLALDPPP